MVVVLGLLVFVMAWVETVVVCVMSLLIVMLYAFFQLFLLVVVVVVDIRLILNPKYVNIVNTYGTVGTCEFVYSNLFVCIVVLLLHGTVDRLFFSFFSFGVEPTNFGWHIVCMPFMLSLDASSTIGGFFFSRSHLPNPPLIVRAALRVPGVGHLGDANRRCRGPIEDGCVAWIP